MRIAKLLIATVLASLPIANVAADTMPAPMGREEQAVSRYGTIVAKQLKPTVGLTAWTVERAGTQIVLYTTAPEAGKAVAVIAGVVWDERGQDIAKLASATGLQSSVQGAALIPTKVVPQTITTPSAAMSGAFAGELPPAMHTVDALQGVKEGEGGIGDTVYVIIDPRCPYCQKAYDLTRPYVAQGRTIKWIPTAALGDKANGVPIAATILQATDPAVLARVLGKHEQIKSQPTPESEKALELNLAFMFAAFEQNGGKAGVPVAFYVDHRTGRPQMMTGLSDEAVLEDIFGKL